MNARHTPGPWAVHDRKQEHFRFAIWPAGNKGLAEIAHVLNGSSPEAVAKAEANARLIAAAPELLEALHIIRAQSLGPDYTAEQAIRFIKDYAGEIITKATGGR